MFHGRYGTAQKRSKKTNTESSTEKKRQNDLKSKTAPKYNVGGLGTIYPIWYWDKAQIVVFQT